ncbi:baseplate multidomain protein megatron [Marinibacterium sp. SX1]|uniref:baseplate multidomain protein megatron n=1 Tax=Marinibacterium sp. SX1 TaxID=3388424 RepID=UPI003D171B35
MATILLSAAGAAIGGSLGGTVAGLSTAVLGRAVGATIGRVIDQSLLGAGADPVETGKVDRFRLTNASDGQPITQVYGRMRVGGQVIWASDFQESASTSGGGKGMPKAPKTTRYSYSVSIAIAICEGEIERVSRVWADGEEVPREDLNMRVYTGTPDQLPDPVMEAIEGEGMVPAYRGTAYVVMEDLALEPYGNRVPQFSFEVIRGEQPGSDFHDDDPEHAARAVALIPGTGEYALATTPVYLKTEFGERRVANLNAVSTVTDMAYTAEALEGELPGCKSVSMVVCWFGDDLRCGECRLQPKVEQQEMDGEGMPWSVSGLGRFDADLIARVDDRPVYGGTPSDQAVVEGIRHLRDQGQEVMFYPFILMDQMEGNTLPDPWTGATGQPPLPWRGRVTLSVAPGRADSPDGTIDADIEVGAFFGTASAGDFQVGDGVVTYTGPEEWSLRRFILHYAALCAAAGGVEAFCIGSEMRSLTQIRGAGGFAAVEELRSLAAEVRTILGPDTRLGYAADWSEYFGYQPQDGSGDRYFHLDPLWADPQIDFIGIDNYMPLSDWREGEDHLDAGWGHVYNPEYLAANVEGGEGYDWFYHSDAARAAQIRTPISDGDHDEPWIWRYKDIRNWWANAHHERIGGQRQAAPTAWLPQSKPIWFTELGCAAVDKGTNQPNKFLDPKSSESSLPYFSTGRRDDLIQMQYLRVMLDYWADPARNPMSEEYEGRMLDIDRSFIWAWDARPFPVFPNNGDLWSDGANYRRGHWISGRIGGRSLASVVAEICRRAGLTAYDVSELWGYVRGYAVEDVGDARQALQPLMLRYGFDAVERDGVLKFVLRDGRGAVAVEADELAESADVPGRLEQRREAEAELAGRVRLRFVEAEANHDIVAEEAVLPDDATHAVTANDLPMSMTRAEGRAVAERWLAEARVARDTARLALPPSALALGAGDVIRLPVEAGETPALYRVDQVEMTDHQVIEAVRIEPGIYEPSDAPEDLPSLRAFVPPMPVEPLFLDLPLIRGDEVPHAPHLAVTGNPWPGSVAVYASDTDEAYSLSEVIDTRATIGVTETPLDAAPAGLWDNGAALQVRLYSGTLETRPEAALFTGANLMAIGAGSAAGTGNDWELFQFREAELIGPDTYLLTGRLRGQLGTDGIMPDVWPAGSRVVLLDGVPGQIDLAAAARRIARHYRIGPARRGYDDPSYTHVVAAFDGVGLRPYAPCHLAAVPTADGLELSWVRRTRIDGDSWELDDVPLGEDSETYRIRIRAGQTILREATADRQGWSYAAGDLSADLAAGADAWEVAQISQRYGPGPYARCALTEAP